MMHSLDTKAAYAMFHKTIPRFYHHSLIVKLTGLKSICSRKLYEKYMSLHHNLGPCFIQDQDLRRRYLVL